MIDIHSHLLPYLDDGAASLEESLSMARLYVEDGIQTVVTTPHSIHRQAFTAPQVQERFDLLQQALQEQHIPLGLIQGMEVFATTDIRQQIQQGQARTIGDTYFMLLEFSFTEDAFTAEDILLDVLDLGICPIIAHPERYHMVRQDWDLLYDWKDMGALLQINRGSIFGRFGEEAFDISDAILRERLVDFVGSDAHGVSTRRPCLSDAYSYIKHTYSSNYANFLCFEHPSKLLKQVETRQYE